MVHLLSTILLWVTDPCVAPVKELPLVIMIGLCGLELFPAEFWRDMRKS